MDEREPEIQLDRRGGLKSVGVHVARLTLPLAQRRGTATARLALEWPRIVGPEIAGHSLPERLIGAPQGDKSNRRPPRREGGTLRLRVDGPLALELQHLAPQLIERINSYFGYAAVARLQIVQGPLPRRPVPTRPVRPPLDAAQARALQARLQPVGDAGLRSALERLGRAVLARR
ncbi:MAG TPA: DciA family protein [Vineibacter sp.]|nr:DciA family protein [Vineibacter sp.]